MFGASASFYIILCTVEVAFCFEFKMVWFWYWEWTPSIGRKLGIPRGILPHIQTGLTNWNPDNSLSHPGLTNWNPDNCLIVCW